MRFVLNLLMLSILSMLSHVGYGQDTPHMKFGKPLKEELKMITYPQDTSASAVVLVDHGESYLVYDQSKGFQLVFDRYTRIKILNKEGYNWADVAVSLYEDENGEERISSVKGFTYNLENGQIQKTKLDKSSIFEEQSSEHWKLKKFTMPNVKEGSVIEYTYTVSSEFLFQFRDWSFQKSIPVAWSEYKAIIPEYFDYKQINQGYLPLTITEQDTSPGSLQITSTTVNGTGTQYVRSQSTSKIDYRNHKYRWVIANVPAFKSERFITTSEDYISKIQFELSSTKYPGAAMKRIMDTWETLDKRLLESDYFGNALKKNGFIKDQVASITVKSNNDLEKVQNIYSFVQENMKWNGIKTKYVESTLKKAFDVRAGNSADINLLLVSMLRKAGLEANPVILSTRDHGQILTYYPIVTRFNYVIAEVNIDGKTYLLDATDKYCPLNTLPYRCLNNQGRRISEHSDWVDLTNTSGLTDVRNFALSLSADGKLEGTLVESKNGYTAANLRKQIKETGKDEFVEDKFENKAGWALNSFKFDNLESTEKALVSTYDITISETAESIGDLIYLNPVLPADLKENPFKIEERLYPVDMGCPYKETYMISIAIPEGYAIDELPKPSAMKLPDASAVFRYNVQQVGNNINLTSQIIIKKAIYEPGEYALLKELFNSIVDKHNQQIVLKKI